MTTETKDLPVVGYYGLNESGYAVIALKENAVLRMFDAGEVTAQPVCLVSDALEAIRTSATSAPEHGWLPIETAPKDSKSVLLIVGGVVEVGFFGGVTGWIIERHIYKGLPSHWQPLPPPPGTTPQPAEGA